jgi:hypothetical protein
MQVCQNYVRPHTELVLTILPEQPRQEVCTGDNEALQQTLLCWSSHEIHQSAPSSI